MLGSLFLLPCHATPCLFLPAVPPTVPLQPSLLIPPTNFSLYSSGSLPHTPTSICPELPLILHVAHQDGDAAKACGIQPPSQRTARLTAASRHPLAQVSRSLLGKDSSWQIFLQCFASSGLGLDLDLRIFLKKTTTTSLKIIEEMRDSTELAAPTSFSSVRS